MTSGISTVALLLMFGSNMLLLHAQPAPVGPATHAADQAWAVLSQRPTRGVVKREPAELSDDWQASPLKAEINRLIQDAEEARLFHSNYPAHARANSAKKMEALARLSALALGAADAGGQTRAAAQLYRNDKRNAVEDRFEVALAAECLDLSSPARALGGHSPQEQLADTLHAEFGGIPQVNQHYISLLRTLDPTASARVLAKLNQRTLSEDLKQEVQRAQAVALRRGKPIELTLATLDGKKVDFAQSAAVTVVCFWNVWAGPRDINLLGALKGKVVGNVNWVYVGLGGTAPLLNSLAAFTPFPGAHCHDAAGLAGAAAAALGVQQAPSVAVLGLRGKLIGSGSFDQLPALLTEASR